MTIPFTIIGLKQAYESGTLTPEQVLSEVGQRIEERGDADQVWISRFTHEEILGRIREVEDRRGRGEEMPLFGIPFAVKDNIDAIGLPTTAGCPAFAYEPAENSTAVRRLLDAGAILIGKTNLDQFATGLVGTRSPHGFPRSVANPDYISGGSSSGSAVAVAGGVMAFSLGTDTAGSGRVPAAFNGIVGLKPTRGRIGNSGVVPACRSLDCVSIFAHSSEDAALVLKVLEGEDPGDPYSRSLPGGPLLRSSDPFRFGTPPESQLEFFGDEEARELFRESIAAVEAIGGVRYEFDFAPFRETAELLYGGPWVAERDAAVGDFIRAHPEEVHPVVRDIILGGADHSAVDTFRAMYRLEELRARTQPVWDQVDLLLLPTTGTIFRADEVLASPVELNSKLGIYTNFMNLLDLCGVALPAGVRRNRTPFGVTFAGPAFSDEFLLSLSARYERYRAGDETPLPEPSGGAPSGVLLAVVGAHLTGEPLNFQLADRGAALRSATRTAPSYRLFALSGTTPPKPGLVRVSEGGVSIEVEVWELSHGAFGAFVEEVPSPLAIGSLELEDGTTVKGFVCEPIGLDGAADISSHGGWRAYRRSGT